MAALSLALAPWLLPLVILILDGAHARATYGMRIRSLRFADPAGREISFLRCAARISLGLILIPLLPVSWIIALLALQRKCRTTRAG